MTTKEIALTAARALSEKKGIDVRLLEVAEVTTLAEYFLICTGTSNTHVNTLCDAVEEAVEAAKVNAELNGIKNCSFIAGDVLKVIDEIEERPDFLILDPPRDGIHPKALTKLLDRYEGERILYISCKPTSLVRDMEVIKEYGFNPTRMCAVDMFPGTPNVEVICLFSSR